MLLKKYLPVPDEDSLRGSSSSPASMTSFGGASLQEQDGTGGGGLSFSAPSHNVMEDYCRDLLEVVDALAFHHSQLSAP